jgi:hypothetical protein
MSRQVNARETDQLREKLTEARGYIREDPPAAGPPETVPHWAADSDDVVTAVAERLIEMDLRVAEYQTHLRSLGLTPAGRRRKALATQLAEAYLDPQRLAKAGERLTASDRAYAARLLLNFQLQDLHIDPDDVYWEDYHEDWTQLVKPLVKTGLLLQDETNAGLIVFPELRPRLPELHIAFPQTQSPETFASVADPHILLGQLQQMMGLIQSAPLALRPRLQWQAPEYPHAQRVTCWPPTPADARALISNVQRARTIELLPPEPRLDRPSLDRLTAALDATEQRIAFLYHLLVSLGIVWPGDPPTIDSDLAQAWMALPPRRQLGAIYEHYRDLTAWAAWWPRWQHGEVHLRLFYHGYWKLMSIDSTIEACVRNMRKTVLEILSYLPDDVWLSIDKLGHWLGQLFPTAETHHYLMGLKPSCGNDNWRAFLRVVLMDMLTGPLYALGLVELAPSLEGATAVRLKDLQAIHWGRTRALTLETDAQLSLGAKALNFVPEAQVIEVTTPIPPDFTAVLLRWASPVGFSRNLIRYHLDVDKLRQTFEQGEDPETLSAAWQACVHFAPPPEIEAWWADWYARYARVRLYPPQALLQTRDAMTMQELQVALPSLQTAITSALSPEAALLKPDQVDKLLEDLTRQGYMPKESS